MPSFLFIAIGIINATLGQLFYKLFFIRKKKIFFILACILLVSLPYVNYHALLVFSMDTVALYSALVLVTMHILSFFILHEQITTVQKIGAILILSGLVLYSF